MSCNTCSNNDTLNSFLLDDYGFDGYSNAVGDTVDGQISIIRNNGTLSPYFMTAESQVPSVYGLTDKNTIEFKKSTAALFVQYYNQAKRGSFTLTQYQPIVDSYVRAVASLGSGQFYVPTPSPFDLSLNKPLQPPPLPGTTTNRAPIRKPNIATGSLVSKIKNGSMKSDVSVTDEESDENGGKIWGLSKPIFWTGVTAVSMAAVITTVYLIRKARKK